MAVLQMSPRQREQSREPEPSRDTGVVVEVSRFAVLIVCFAISVGVVIQRDHRQVNGPGVKPGCRDSSRYRSDSSLECARPIWPHLIR